MQTISRFSWRASASHFALVFALTLASSGRAQIYTPPVPTPSVPVVTIQATVSQATWGGSPGVFTVFRTGNPALALNVYYQINGTAANGTDYKTIGNWVRLPSGVLSSEIIINPINTGQTGVKTVTLTVTNSPLMSPGMYVNYTIGSPSTATVDITAGLATNLPPVVSLLAPTNGATYWTPTNLYLMACAKDLDGTIASVEFLADGVRVGIATNPIGVVPLAISSIAPFPPMPPYRPYVLVWTNVPPGTNLQLTAKATDNAGAYALSAPVSITVHPGPQSTPPPPTNLPPVVRITSPADGATFRAPLNLPLFAYAADKDGSVTNVEFFAGINDLGTGQRASILRPPTLPGPYQPMLLIGVPLNYWELVWSNVPQGNFALTAVATDNLGQATISDPVNLDILPPISPVPTNVVNIVAIDPLAIVGTNCWPWLGVAGATPSWTNWAASSSVLRYFTSCGPKNALFQVHRLGQTNSDLDVAYGIGGTATNGVDYMTLPGKVTVPAGSRDALITIVPLDETPPVAPRTVVLSLTPSANYVLGRPASAAAIIVGEPGPVPAVLPDRIFHVAAAGPDGAWFHIEYTTNLLNWTALCTNQVIHGAIDFLDPEAPASQTRFYRAVPEESGQ